MSSLISAVTVLGLVISSTAAEALPSFLVSDLDSFSIAFVTTGFVSSCFFDSVILIDF